MRYKVIDEFSGEVQYFDNLKEARKEAFNIQGLLYDREKLLVDYSEF
ncbi:hypothetical protein [uncultured Fusobacterium sp.]|nr:hypothetical protein [uncultured Fusobacterium sp.]